MCYATLTCAETGYDQDRRLTGMTSLPTDQSVLQKTVLKFLEDPSDVGVVIVGGA